MNWNMARFLPEGASCQANFNVSTADIIVIFLLLCILTYHIALNLIIEYAVVGNAVI